MYLKNTFFLTIIFASLFQFAVANEHIQIATGEYSPYTSAKLPNNGFINHIISSAFAEVNIDVEFIYLPWPRAYQKTTEGVFSTSSYWYYSKKHEKDFYLSDPLYQEKVLFFRLKSDSEPVWNGFDDLVKLKIGLSRGFTYTPEMWEFAESHKATVSVVNSDQQNLEMLLLKRIDLFPGEELSVWKLLRTEFAAEQQFRVESITPALLNNFSHVLFSKKHPNAKKLRDEFNRGLKRIIENGVLDELKLKLIRGYYNESGQ